MSPQRARGRRAPSLPGGDRDARRAARPGRAGADGLTTGEVVTGTEERLATGDAVNVAARLEQAAAPGEILIGEPTLKLVREAVEAEPVEPLALKGKAEPVPALPAPFAAGRARALHVARFVGRERELALVHASWERARSEAALRAPHRRRRGGSGQVPPGGRGAGARSTAASVGGRCLPYGEGITYWPLVEVLKQLNVLPSDAAAAAAIRSLLGESEAADSAEEIAWAFRKLLEEQAPLVVLFDDIQWADGDVPRPRRGGRAARSRCAALLVCMARPELDRAPPLLAGSDPRSSRSQPTRQSELLPAQPSATTCARGSPAPPGGNPLFLTEMVAMASEAEGDVAVPATLRALLAARLDQLEPDERSVLERGAVEGEIFHRGAVQALSPDGQVTPRLAALVRKGLIRPDKAQLPGEEAFRFHHLLLRDAAYEALPKSVRADLHERFADWLEQHGTPAGRAGRDPRLPPRAGGPLPRRARAGQRGARPRRRRPPRRRGPARLLARRLAERRPRCSSARSRSRVRTGSTSAWRSSSRRRCTGPTSAGGRGCRGCRRARGGSGRRGRRSTRTHGRRVWRE